VKDSRTPIEPIRTYRVGIAMTRTPIFSSSPLVTDVLTVSPWSVTKPTLFGLFSSSLEPTRCLSPLHTQSLLNRFIAIPSHSSSDPALTASNVQKLIYLIRSSQLRQLHAPYHLLPEYLVSSGKFLTVSLPDMDEMKDRRRFVSAKG
jgi:hypothetical protein